MGVAMRKPRRAVVVADLVAVAVVVPLLGAAVLAMASRSHGEGSSRVKCSSNLRQIAMAAIMYANAEVRTGAFPRTYYNPVLPIPTVYTGVNAADSFAPAG